MVRDECVHVTSRGTLKNLDITVQASEDGSSNGQAQAQALLFPAVALTDLIKTLENLFAQFRRNNRTFILNDDADTTI